MTTPTKSNHQEFLARLQKVAADRGNRAALRRYWSPTTRHHAYLVLGQLGALRDDCKTIYAALYAAHPEHRTGVGVGKAALLLGSRKAGEHPYDRHFRRLLACEDLNDLSTQLHRLVKRLSRAGIGFDYAALHKDLNFWANHREIVKVRWASEFWQAPNLQATES